MFTNEMNVYKRNANLWVNLILDSMNGTNGTNGAEKQRRLIVDSLAQVSNDEFNVAKQVKDAMNDVNNKITKAWNLMLSKRCSEMSGMNGLLIQIPMIHLVPPSIV